MAANDYKKQGFSEAAAVGKAMKDEAAPKGFVDLKKSKEKIKKDREPMTISSYDEYPYGLRIDLDGDAMKKLKMDLPKVGTEMTITVKAKVVRAEMNESESGGPRKSCCLQITKMKV